MKNTKEFYQVLLNEINSSFNIDDNRYTGGYVITNENHDTPSICGYNADDELDLHNFLLTLIQVKKQFPKTEFTEELIEGINKIIGMAECVRAYNSYTYNEMLLDKTLSEYQKRYNVPANIWALTIYLTMKTIVSVEIDTYTDSEGCTYNSLDKVLLS